MTMLLNLYVRATALIPTRSELRAGLLTGAAIFLLGVAAAPLWQVWT